jgi:SRSO17 transposase
MEEQDHDASKEEQLLHQAAEEVARVQARIGPYFRRSEARSRAGRFLQGLLAPVERKNGWQMAEALGERGPRGVQRLVGGGGADWEEEALRDELRSYVVERLGEPTGVLVADETDFIKKGKKSAGVARQYSGTAGRRENSQIGVFLLYASGKGAAFLDRALYLPEEWTSDRARCREAGIPDEVGFATRGELARQMLARAFAARVPAQWVMGGTVSGYDELHLWLDGQQRNYVLAIAEAQQVWAEGRPQPVGQVAAHLPQEAWVVLSAGEGSEGPQLYAWAWLQQLEQMEAANGRGRWILIRRSLTDPSQRAYYRVAGPADLTLAELVCVAGSRWKIEQGLEEAKGEVGLDHYEVRSYRAWYRFVTLALWAHAVLVAVRSQLGTPEKSVKAKAPTEQ